MRHCLYTVHSGTAGALLLHAPVTALLLHPVRWHRRASEHQDTVGPPTANEDASEKQKPLGQSLLRGSSVPTDLLKLEGGFRLELENSKRFRSGSECHTDKQWLERRGSAYHLGGSTFMAGSVLTLHDNEVSRP